MTCGCSSKKKNQKSIENYQMSPCLEQATMDYNQCSNNKNKECFKKGIKDYKECLGSGIDFIYSETGYRQATKCPCPFEYPSKNRPRIPFI